MIPMRRVTSRLWLGNANEARDMTLVHDHEIQAIVDLAADEPVVRPTRELIYNRVPLIDGNGNSVEQIRLAVNIVLQLLESDIRTLVACSAGISRSPLIAAAAMAFAEDNPLTESLKTVAAAGSVDVSPGLFNDVRRLFETSK